MNAKEIRERMKLLQDELDAPETTDEMRHSLYLMITMLSLGASIVERLDWIVEHLNEEKNTV